MQHLAYNTPHLLQLLDSGDDRQLFLFMISLIRGLQMGVEQVDERISNFDSSILEALLGHPVDQYAVLICEESGSHNWVFADYKQAPIYQVLRKEMRARWDGKVFEAHVVALFEQVESSMSEGIEDFLKADHVVVFDAEHNLPHPFRFIVILVGFYKIGSKENVISYDFYVFYFLIFEQFLHLYC